MKFRKKPVVIDAVQFQGFPPTESGNKNMFLEWEIQSDKNGPFLIIETLEGNHRCNLGDWIITGVKGERYPCKPDIFEATYERAD